MKKTQTKEVEDQYMTYTYTRRYNGTLETLWATMALGALLGVFAVGVWVTTQELFWLTYSLYKATATASQSLLGLF